MYEKSVKFWMSVNVVKMPLYYIHTIVNLEQTAEKGRSENVPIDAACFSWNSIAVISAIFKPIDLYEHDIARKKNADKTH